MTNDIKQRIEQINRGEVPQGYKKTEVGIVPQEWEDKTIGQIGKFSKGKGIPGTEMKSEGLPCIGYGDIYTKYNYKFDKTCNFVDDEIAKESTKAEKGAVFFTCSGETAIEIGKCVCYTGDEPIYVGGDIAILKTNKQVDPLFLAYQQNIPASITKKAQYGQGHSVVHIYSDSLSKLYVAYPKKLNEQQNITKIIAKWDEAIELQEKLIAKLEEQKKALMQKLLTPKEGWKEFVLGDLGITYGGLNGKRKSDFGTGKPYITYMNIFSNSIINKDKFEYVTIDENEVQNKAIYGDIFFTTSSETPEEVGFSAVLLDNIENLYLNSFCFGFRLNNFETLLPEFAAYYFRSHTFREILKTLAQGATRFNLSKTNLMKNSILLPSVKKQEKFANIFLRIEKIIKLENCKLNSMKQQQKALQQLLLTGIVRV